MALPLALLASGAGGVLVITGLTLMLGGAIGVLRFPDIYTRIHAAGADSIGVTILLFGLAVAAGDWAILARLVLLAGLTGVLGGTFSQLVSNAAHTGGLSPLAGSYKAPRPGAPRARRPCPRRAWATRPRS